MLSTVFRMSVPSFSLEVILSITIAIIDERFSVGCLKIYFIKSSKVEVIYIDNLR